MRETLELRVFDGQIVAEKLYFSSMDSLYDFASQIQILYETHFRHESNEHGRWERHYETITQEQNNINI